MHPARYPSFTGFKYNSVLDGLPDKILDSTKEAANEHFQVLLKFISPAAELTNTPSLLEFCFKEIKLKILNYTQVKLSFIFKDKLYLIANKNPVASIAEENCHLVAYHVKESPLICIDSKKNHMDLPKDRLFISSQGERCELGLNDDGKFENLLGVPAMEPLEGEKFLETDPTIVNLLKELDPHANFETKSLKIYHSRFDKYLTKHTDASICRLTILNLTNERVTFDIRRNFRINGKKIVTFTPDHCQLIAYRLKDFPKYLHILVQDEGHSSFQKISYEESWERKNQPNQTTLDAKKSSALQKNSFQPIIKFQQAQSNDFFSSEILNEILRNHPHFSELIQEISADAVGISEPTLVERYSAGKTIRILNLTYHSLSFIGEELHLKGLPITKDPSANKKLMNPNNLVIIAYKVLKNPHIICLDFKEINDSLAQERFFIVKKSNRYFLTVASPSSEIFGQSLFSIRPKQNVTADLKIVNHPFLSTLPTAIWKNKIGCLTIYPSRSERNSTIKRFNISIINYSTHCITMDIFGRLWIDSCAFAETLEKNSIFVAFQPEGNSEKIQFKNTNGELNFEKKWSCLNSGPYYQKFFKTVHFERVYSNLWRPHYDSQSSFSRLPKELIQQIAHLYLKCLKKYHFDKE